MRTWICTTMASFLGPQQGAARLYAYLKKQGHDVSLKDFNQDTYFTLLSKDYLEQTFEKLKRTVDPAKRSKFLREDTGSLLLYSSNRAMKQLLAKGILLDSSWYRFVRNGDI